MDSVKRYDCNGRVRPMQENPEGPWMLYSDYTALRARLEAVTEERNVQNELRQIAEDAADELRDRAERAELEVNRWRKAAEKGSIHTQADLATARRDALEEAAKTVESLWAYRTCAEVAEAIRALANEAET